MGKIKENITVKLLILISIFFAVVTCSYLAMLDNTSNQLLEVIKFIIRSTSIKKFLFFCILYSGVSIGIYKKGKEIGDILYKFRFLIVGILFLFCVIFEISGSSIGMWKYCVGNDLDSTGDILGKARAIRGDEWAVYTPFAISQEENKPENYGYFSNIIRGSNTDVFIVYGQPVKDISIIFRPFQIGYLLFGSSRGLSFFWCGRFIALFLVMFELSMLITKKRKDISLISAILVTLAPAVQWWFAVNGFIEMLVFGGLSILLLEKYMKTSNFWKRLIYLLIIGICGGGFILTFYPAWQIPMAYIILALAIWVIIENKKECKKIKIIDIISILCVIALTLGLLFNIYTKSKDTINSVMNTAYPGARCEQGGGMVLKYFSYPTNIFFTIDENDIEGNVCEAAVFMDLCPLGFILAYIVLFKQKNKDKLLKILLILSAFFAIWEIIGLPKFLAKITLLYVSPAQRTMVVVGFLNVLILIRSMALLDKSKSSITKHFVLSFLLAVFVTMESFTLYTSYYNAIKVLITIAFLSLLYTVILQFDNEKYKKVSISFIIISMMFTSFLINPIRRGMDVIKNQPIGNEIKNIEEKDSGLWLVEGFGYPTFNFPIMYGAPTINSTNVYPNLERLKKLDPESKYEEIYNRYAHITVEFTTEEVARFELPVLDSYKIYLPIKDLKTLDVKYIFTSNDLEKFESEAVGFEKLYDEYNAKIYKVLYK